MYKARRYSVFRYLQSTDLRPLPVTATIDRIADVEVSPSVERLSLKSAFILCCVSLQPILPILKYFSENSKVLKNSELGTLKSRWTPTRIKYALGNFDPAFWDMVGGHVIHFISSHFINWIDV